MRVFKEQSLFQSTPPVKAATEIRLFRLMLRCISIHAAREGGDARLLSNQPIKSAFQSTPPVKAATHRRGFLQAESKFQSTPPVKAATLLQKLFVPDGQISIHAAREGGDVVSFVMITSFWYFNPRRP